jgi:Raf kinase inhibitor-like YbhB/YbcL family protein
MQLRSSDYATGGVIPRALMAVDCGGQNRSPELAWSEAPKNAKSFALIMHDADAPVPGGFYHWVVYNLPASTHQLAGDAKLAAGQLGKTSNEKPGYYGPCPPPDPTHHYTLTLYALDLAHISADAPLTGPELEGQISGHVIEHAAIVGTVRR